MIFTTTAATRRALTLALVLIAAGALLSACTKTTLISGAAATGGTAFAQERSVSDAIDDTAIELALSKHLLNESTELFLDVDIDAYEGRVMLTGDVEKPRHRIRALELAWQVEGVNEVINEIQVRDQTSLIDHVRDIWISTQLATELLYDKKILSINYNIETVNGVIYLIGIAQDVDELERVIARARNIAYVHQVVSHVRLKGELLHEAKR
jgi:osmotically-inducible protein OsmY